MIPEQPSRPKENQQSQPIQSRSSDHDGVRSQATSTRRSSPRNAGGVASNDDEASLHNEPGERASSTSSTSSDASGKHGQDLRQPYIERFEEVIISGDERRLRGGHDEQRESELSPLLSGAKSGQFLPQPGPGDRPDPSNGGTSTTVRPWRGDEALCVPEAGPQLQETVLALCEESRKSMSDLPVVPGATISGSSLPTRGGRVVGPGHHDIEPNGKIPDERRELAQGGPAEVPTQAHDAHWNQSLQDSGEVRPMRKDAAGGEDGPGTPDRGQEEQEGDGTDTPGVPGMEEIGSPRNRRSLDRQGPKLVQRIEKRIDSELGDDALVRNKGVKHVLSQATSALGATAEMWQNLITHVQPGSPEADQCMSEFSQRILDPHQPGRVSDRRQLKQLASLLGVTKKKARLVAEVFNPNRFGPQTKGTGLDPGMAFDLTLGDDLLRNSHRQKRETVHSDHETWTCCHFHTMYHAQSTSKLKPQTLDKRNETERVCMSTHSGEGVVRFFM